MNSYKPLPPQKMTPNGPKMVKNGKKWAKNVKIEPDFGIFNIRVSRLGHN